MKTVINTTNAPAPIGPYNQSVLAGGLIFVSGQIPLDHHTGQLITDDITAATKLVLNHIKSILKEAGADFSHIVKTSIFLKDMNDFAQVNEVYGTYFTADFPARETVQVAALPKGVQVEISVIAVKP
ncbi:RidA family protein [Mucilaginibacter puniceus]